MTTLTKIQAKAMAEIITNYNMHNSPAEWRAWLERIYKAGVAGERQRVISFIDSRVFTAMAPPNIRGALHKAVTQVDDTNIDAEKQS